MAQKHTDEEEQTAAENDLGEIDPWVFEICTVHGDVDATDRFDQMEELVERLANSTDIPIEDGFDVGKEARKSHRLMLDNAVFEGCLEDYQKRSLLNAFDRLVGAWIQSPTEISAELEEYRSELSTVRREQAGDGQ